MRYAQPVRRTHRGQSSRLCKVRSQPSSSPVPAGKGSRTGGTAWRTCRQSSTMRTSVPPDMPALSSTNIYLMFLPQYYKFVFIDLSSNHPYPTSFHNRSIFHIPAPCGREGLDSAGVAARGHVNGRGLERSEGRDLPVGAKPLPAAKRPCIFKKTTSECSAAQGRGGACRQEP